MKIVFTLLFAVLILLEFTSCQIIRIRSPLKPMQFVQSFSKGIEGTIVNNLLRWPLHIRQRNQIQSAESKPSHMVLEPPLNFYNPVKANGEVWSNDNRPIINSNPFNNFQFNSPISSQLVFSNYDRNEKQSVATHQRAKIVKPFQNQAYGVSTKTHFPSSSPGWGWQPKCYQPKANETYTFNKISDIPNGAKIYDGTGPNRKLLNLVDVFIDPVPKSPKVLKLDFKHPLPENYTIVYWQQQEVQLYPPSNSPPFSVRTTIHYNGDLSKSVSIFKSSDEQPKANTIQSSIRVVQTPKISAPLTGSKDNSFKEGIRNRTTQFPNRRIKNPLVSQIEELTKLYNELSDFFKKQSNSKVLSEKFKINSPVLVTKTQRFTIPNPKTVKSSAIESFYTFGLGAHPIEFGSTEGIKEHWQSQLNEIEEINLNSLGDTVSEIGDNFREWVRTTSKEVRQFSDASYREAEKFAYDRYYEFNYFIELPGLCTPIEIDPCSKSQAVSNQGSMTSNKIPQSYKRPLRRG